MRPSTIPDKFGKVSREEELDIMTLHEHLLETKERGLKVDTDLLEGAIEVLSVSGKHKKELRTLEAMRNRVTNGNEIQPDYDLFRKGGRTFLYAVFPNLPESTMSSLFQGDLIPISTKGNPIEAISRIASLLREGARVGPLIGESLYLDISPLVATP